ncbi:hypothetical protein LINPERHAP2_LOCUS30062 [Linum perenne]
MTTHMEHYHSEWFPLGGMGYKVQSEEGYCLGLHRLSLSLLGVEENSEGKISNANFYW